MIRKIVYGAGAVGASLFAASAAWAAGAVETVAAPVAEVAPAAAAAPFMNCRQFTRVSSFTRERFDTWSCISFLPFGLLQTEHDVLRWPLSIPRMDQG